MLLSAYQSVANDRHESQDLAQCGYQGIITKLKKIDP